jgi:OOP family OmpA-OmpF porin
MRIRTTILAGVFLLATGSAAAADVDSGFYLGLGIGKSKANLNSADFSLNDPVLSRESKEETDTGYKVMAGWRLGRYFAVELAYADLGKYNYAYTVPTLPNGEFKTSRINYKATSWSASAIGTIPVKGDLSALLRLGVTSNRAQRSGLEGGFFVGPPNYPSASKRTTSLLWGAGGQYDLTKKVAVRLEFEHYGHFGEAVQNRDPVGFPLETGQAKVWMWSLSGIYVF